MEESGTVVSVQEECGNKNDSMKVVADETVTVMTTTRQNEIVGASGGVDGTTTANKPSHVVVKEDEDEDETSKVYYALVIDSGPIIKLQTSLFSSESLLWNRAKHFYTVPAVVAEIRDSRAREQFQLLEDRIRIQTPTPQSVHKIIEFSRQTGDYPSLSSVDVQVLALTLDLELEAAAEGGGTVSHIRTTPKRILGLGNIQTLPPKKKTATTSASGAAATVTALNPQQPPCEEDEDDVDDDDDASGSSSDDDSDDDDDDQRDDTNQQQPVPKSWAKIVNPAAASATAVPTTTTTIATAALSVPFGKMKLTPTAADEEGQFSDAEEENDPTSLVVSAAGAGSEPPRSLDEELELEFPSLAAAATVPFEEDEEENEENNGEEEAVIDNDNIITSAEARRQLELQKEQERKEASLRPISKSGKLYNSFRKYGDLMKPAAASKKKESNTSAGTATTTAATFEEENEDRPPENHGQSRILGMTGGGDQDDDVDDDGEGWITCTKEIHTMKATGMLDPTHKPNQKQQQQQPPKGDGTGATNAAITTAIPKKSSNTGPPIHQRAACATTDFAMQNVLLQMGMHLLSLDGVKIRKLKTYVQRCGACFKIYTDVTGAATGSLPTKLLGKRLFCERCGSDMIRRVAASVDSKTGRLRLHFSKNGKFKHNLRGTKFSLPTPGSNNRFQGDLLLREDQLLMGAWNQKLKMRTGGKAKQAAHSMFGKGIAADVGCQVRTVTDEDIRVGFGRRNPNSAKGRERRGKKKKTPDTACGLRRY